MFNRVLVWELLAQIHGAALRIARRFKTVRSVDDWLLSEEGIERLDGICMLLIAIGESLKKLDRMTEQKLLIQYPQVDWKSAKGMRDVLSHQYFSLDAEAVFDVCRQDIPILIETLERIMNAVKNGSAS